MRDRLRLAVLPLLVLLVASIASVPRAHAQAAGISCRYLGYNIASPGNATNIITTDIGGTAITGLTPLGGVSKFLVTVSLATTSVFNLRVTDGTTAFTTALNGGVALTSGQTYTFVFGTTNRKPVQDQNATPSVLLWNFQVATTGTIQLLQVDEVTAPVD